MTKYLVTYTNGNYTRIESDYFCIKDAGEVVEFYNKNPISTTQYDHWITVAVVRNWLSVRLDG